MSMDMYGYESLFGFESLGMEEDKKKTEKPEKKQTNVQATEMTEDLDEELDEEDMLEEKTAAPKEKPKAASKSSSKKSSSKKKKVEDGDTEVLLPIRVIASTFSYDVQEIGTKKLSEIFDLLYEEGYVEVACKRSCVLDKENGVIYLLDEVAEIDEKSCVSFTETDAVVFAIGLSHDIFTTEDFEDMGSDEIGLEDVAELIESHSPAYLGSTYSYSPEKGVMVPVLKNFRELHKEAVLPMQYYYYGTLRELDGEGKAEPELRKCYEVNDKLIHLRLVVDGANNVVPVFEAASGNKKLTLTKAESKKLEVKKELYKLPLTCWLANIGIELELTSSMFNGKAKIDKEDVRAALGQEYAIFRKKEKQLDCQYIKAANRLAVNVSSSTKGACAEAIGSGLGNSLVRKVVNREKLISLLQSGTQGCYYCVEAGFTPLRLENTAIGRFVAEVDSLQNLSSLRFQSKLPKVPYGLLQTIIADFKRDLTREAVVQIYWNTKTRNFYLVRPQIEDVSKCHVTFRNKFRGQHNVLFLTVHSHNTMPAVFSSVDNEDECYTGLFGVIGDLDKEQPSMRFRAGMEGTFANVAMDNIFSFV